MELIVNESGMRATGTPEEIAKYMVEMGRLQSQQAAQEFTSAFMNGFSSLWSSSLDDEK